MSHPNIEICLAAESDAESLIHLHYAAVQNIEGRFYPQKVLAAWSPPPSPARYAWMRGMISTDGQPVWVTKQMGKTCGFSISTLADGFIKALYIHPAFAGQGIGKCLLTFTEQQLAQQGRATATLKASINAVAFYQAAGYRVIAPATQTLGDGSEMKCLEMEKALI